MAKSRLGFTFPQLLRYRILFQPPPLSFQNTHIYPKKKRGVEGREGERETERERIWSMVHLNGRGMEERRAPVTTSPPKYCLRSAWGKDSSHPVKSSARVPSVVPTRSDVSAHSGGRTPQVYILCMCPLTMCIFPSA